MGEIWFYINKVGSNRDNVKKWWLGEQVESGHGEKSDVKFWICKIWDAY